MYYMSIKKKRLELTGDQVVYDVMGSGWNEKWEIVEETEETVKVQVFEDDEERNAFKKNETRRF